MDDGNILGSNIRRRRKQLRWSQTDLADRIGVTITTVLRYEAGRTGMSVDRLRDLAVALYCSPADLLDPEWDFAPPHESYGEVV